MTVSSRTPEGLPSHCPLCGASANIEFSDLPGDACCPNCGCLLWASAQLIETVTKWHWDVYGTSLATVSAETRFSEFNRDSLGLVELAMKLEEVFEIQIPDEAYNQLQTFGDIVRYIKVNRRDTDSSN